MRVVEISTYGGPGVLVATERPNPEAGPGQVLVRVGASTVNPVDLLTRAGVLAAMTPHLAPPLVPGWDLAGVVETAAGGFVAGQRVAAMVPWFGVGSGTYAELVAVEPGWLAPLPSGLSDVAAATLPLNGLTARQALDLVDIQPGQVLLVTGASGGVGGFAVQLAAAAGARVLAVASRGDEDHVTSLGAKEVLGRADGEELLRAVSALAPGGVDAVLDAVPVGAALLGALRDGGSYVTVLDPVPELERGIRVAKVSVRPDAAQLRGLVDALASGALTTRVAGTLPLGQAGQAHARAAAGGVRGKLVLLP